MRFLFFVLAFVAALMAFVLDIVWLYAVAAGLVVTALVTVVFVLKKRHSESKKRYQPYIPEKDDLKSYGILEIRPKAASSVSEATGDSIPTEAVEVVPHVKATSVLQDATVNEGTGIVKESEEILDVEDEELVGQIVLADTDVAQRDSVYSDAIYEEPASLILTESEIELPMDAETKAELATPTIAEADIVPIPADLDPEAGKGAGGKVVSVQACLRALQTTLGADTVCLLKQVDHAHTYSIESIVGKANLVKPSGRAFDFKKPLITEDLLVHPVGRLSVARGEVEAESLGYYHAPTAVKDVLFAIVRSPEPQAMYFLVADTTKEKRFDTPRSRAMMLHFAHAIGVALQPTEQEVTRKKEVRSRREIIAEEMARARANELPLALALIHLNGDESLAAQGAEAIVAAETALEHRIRQATLRRGRVERFGELTYGVLYDGTLGEVESWALALHEMLSQHAGVFEHGVSIGAAVLRERHNTADAFRADATEALMESYHTGACIIVE